MAVIRDVIPQLELFQPGSADDALALLAEALGRAGDEVARHRAGADAVRARVAAALSPRSPAPSAGTPAGTAPA